MKKAFRLKLGVVLASFLAVGLSEVTLAQTSAPTRTPSRPIVNLAVEEKSPMPIAQRNNVYCAGYISTQSVPEDLEIVGAEQEADQRNFMQGDFIYINGGSDRSYKVGDVFSVIRPRGTFRTHFSRKGNLGTYVQELGSVEIVDVKEKVSVARVRSSCDSIMIGDLVTPAVTQTAPLETSKPPLDRFADASGKATGRIVLSRDGREMLSRDQIVYIDLGGEDNVRAGDALTVYRPLTGSDRITDKRDSNEISRSQDYGFESRVFRGGKFSNQSPRRKRKDAELNSVVTYSNAVSRRPEKLRKILGEIVILNVKERTATAVITRAAQEIQTGDYVEIQ